MFARRAYVLVIRNTFVITCLFPSAHEALVQNASVSESTQGGGIPEIKGDEVVVVVVLWWSSHLRNIPHHNRPLSRVKNIEVIVVIEEQSKCFFFLCI